MEKLEEINLLILIFFCFCTSYSKGSDHTETVCPKYETATGKTCYLCGSGFYYIRDCILSGDQATCRPCATGSFQEGCNRAAYCQPCSQQCRHRFSEIVEECTPTSDIKCQCIHGYFWHQTVGNEGWCLRHSKCPIGNGVKEPGTHRKDTVCESCIPGISYSNESSSNAVCLPCTRCGEKDQRERTACAISSDTECGDGGDIDEQTSGPTDEAWFLPVVIVSGCVVLGIIVAVIIVILKRYCKLPSSLPCWLCMPKNTMQLQEGIGGNNDGFVDVENLEDNLIRNPDPDPIREDPNSVICVAFEESKVEDKTGKKRKSYVIVKIGASCPKCRKRFSKLYANVEEDCCQCPKEIQNLQDPDILLMEVWDISHAYEQPDENCEPLQTEACGKTIQLSSELEVDGVPINKTDQELAEFAHRQVAKYGNPTAEELAGVHGKNVKDEFRDLSQRSESEDSRHGNRDLNSRGHNTVETSFIESGRTKISKENPTFKERTSGPLFEKKEKQTVFQSSEPSFKNGGDAGSERSGSDTRPKTFATESSEQQLKEVTAGSKTVTEEELPEVKAPAEEHLDDNLFGNVAENMAPTAHGASASQTVQNRKFPPQDLQPTDLSKLFRFLVTNQNPKKFNDFYRELYDISEIIGAKADVIIVQVRNDYWNNGVKEQNYQAMLEWEHKIDKRPSKQLIFQALESSEDHEMLRQLQAKFGDEKPADTDTSCRGEISTPSS